MAGDWRHLSSVGGSEAVDVGAQKVLEMTSVGLAGDPVQLTQFQPPKTMDREHRVLAAMRPRNVVNQGSKSVRQNDVFRLPPSPCRTKQVSC